MGVQFRSRRTLRCGALDTMPTAFLQTETWCWSVLDGGGLPCIIRAFHGPCGLILAGGSCSFEGHAGGVSDRRAGTAWASFAIVHGQPVVGGNYPAREGVGG